MRRRAPLAALFGLAVAGCAVQHPASPLAGSAPAARVTVRADLSPRYVEFIGPKILFAKPFLGVPDTNYFALRSWVDRETGAAAHQLYVAESYRGKRRVWQSARNERGDPLPVVSIGSDEIACDADCSYSDEFAAKLPEALLHDSAERGLVVTFAAQSGNVRRIEVPAAAIRAELAAIEAWRSRAVSTPNSAASAPNPASPSSR